MISTSNSADTMMWKIIECVGTMKFPDINIPQELQFAKAQSLLVF